MEGGAMIRGILGVIVLACAITAQPAEAQAPDEAYWVVCFKSARAAFEVDRQRLGLALAYQVYLGHLLGCIKGREVLRGDER